MTRLLSELLGAREPMFRQGLERLEAASGHQSNDIRLSTEVMQITTRKLRELGLDPRDTTGQELYAALQARVKADDERLAATLQKKYGATLDTVAVIGKALADVPIPKSCFALKATVAKKLLKRTPPKRVMKQLGYRSFESMLKHEQVTALFAAAWLLESATWCKQLLESYKKLTSADFEIRPLTIVAPDSKHWQTVADSVVARKRHNIIGLKELGCVVLLPLPAKRPPAVTLTTLLLALHTMNEVRASGTFLKLCQVRGDFGTLVQTVAVGEATLSAQLLDQPVSWQIIQRYYSRFNHRFRAELFEPHIQLEDLSWHSIEKVLSFLEPSLAFWHHTTHLSLLHDHQPVSLNVIDAALNYCNSLPYSKRIVHYFRHSLMSELLIRYLKHDTVEHTVLAGLESELVEEPALL